MARNIYCRLCLKGSLLTTAPLHVGGYGDDVDTDLPLARDGANRLYVPGTSLAGALREWCERLYDERAVNQLWGYQKEGSDKGHASFVVVEDAVLDNAALVPEIRDHVGIDRQWGFSGRKHQIRSGYRATRQYLAAVCDTRCTRCR